MDSFGSSGAIEFRDLRCFLAAVEHGHLGAAAEALSTTGPEVSRAIGILEDVLGVRLVEWGSDKSTPTATGLAFAERARSIVTALDRAVADARRAGCAPAALRVGAVPTLPLQRLQAFLGALYHRGSLPRAAVSHLRSGEQLARLRRGDLDLAVVYDVLDEAWLETEPLFPGQPLVVFLPVGHRLATRSTLAPADLVDETLLIAPRAFDPGLADNLLAAAAAAGYHFHGVDEAGGADIRDLLMAVADGQGIALAPRTTLQAVSEAGTIVTGHPLAAPLRMPDTVVAWRAAAPPQLAAVVAAAQQTARGLYRSAVDQGSGE